MVLYVSENDILREVDKFLFRNIEKLCLGILPAEHQNEVFGAFLDSRLEEYFESTSKWVKIGMDTPLYVTSVYRVLK